jgi:ABC-type dipeptide/oligopeptide/nickel transport system ATPase component
VLIFSLYTAGNPGSGKTVLATEILQKLQERCSEHSSQATAFQFFSFRYEITRISRTGWSMVLSQLLRQLRNFDRILDQFTFAMTKSEKPQATSGELIELLQAVARGLPGLVLLFDGVDETDDPEEFTSTVSHILEGTSAKVVIVSRPNIKILLDRLDQVPNIHLTREKAQPDIQNYIRCRGSNFGPDDFPPQFSLRFVEEKILLGSNGIILWAKVMLDYLQFGFLDADERAEAIQSLKIHEEITDMYIRILNKIATKNEFIRNRARRIFSWLAFSIHYLQENELWEVICSLKKRSDSPGLLNDPTPTKAQIEEFQKLVIMSCACLVERVRGEYRFVHQSVVEFFWKGLDERKCQSPNIEQFLPSPSQAHNELTAECLSYLLLRVPAKPLSGNIKAGVSKLELSSHIPFAAYAATSWPAHLEKGASFLEESLIMSGSALQRSDIQSILQLLPVLKQFTSAKLSLMVWIEIRYVIGSNISDLIGIRGWSALTRRLSGAYSQLPESFRDLPTTLDAFFTEFEHLDVQWGLTFKEKPHYIWNDSTAFMNTQFLQKTAAVSVSSMIASNFDDGTLSSEPLATCSYSVSNTANGDERLGNLSIWPTR